MKINGDKMNSLKTLGIYIHIPFCVKKCNYCDFVSFTCNNNDFSTYTLALINEIKYYGKIYGKYGINRVISTIYMGGGTPSILPPKLLEDIIIALKNNFNIIDDYEFTIECNPGTLSKEKLLLYKKIGINRLSIGLQSTKASELETLGRIHSYEDFLVSYNLARSLNFKNISIDLMSSLPNQNLDSYKDSLQKIIALKPEHISSYSLIIEEGTPFYEKYNENEELLNDEETERKMYYLTKELLEIEGYERYEISNYAKKGMLSRHNSLYWTMDDYLGFGLNSSSFINNERYKNTSLLSEYINCSKEPENQIKDRNLLSADDFISEFIFLGLRMTRGISKNKFKLLTKKDIMNVFENEINKLINEKLLILDGDFIRLSDKGIDLSNYVFSHFIL